MDWDQDQETPAEVAQQLADVFRKLAADDRNQLAKLNAKMDGRRQCDGSIALRRLLGQSADQLETLHRLFQTRAALLSGIEDGSMVDPED